MSGGVSDETVKYGREFCGTWTQEWLQLYSKLQTRPLVGEGATNQETSNRQTEKKIWSWAPDGSPTPRQTGRLTVGRKLTSLYFT
jgi:hypothetical protein